jgi:hypothetical protein
MKICSGCDSYIKNVRMGLETGQMRMMKYGCDAYPILEERAMNPCAELFAFKLLQHRGWFNGNEFHEIPEPTNLESYGKGKLFSQPIHDFKEEDK